MIIRPELMSAREQVLRVSVAISDASVHCAGSLLMSFLPGEEVTHSFVDGLPTRCVGIHQV
jgi:hypothetical protein